MEYSEHIGKASEIEARMQLYTKATSISVDVAVLEKADNVLTIKAEKRGKYPRGQPGTIHNSVEAILLRFEFHTPV